MHVIRAGQEMHELEASLSWLHSDLTGVDFATVLHDMVRRLAQQPVELRLLLQPRVVSSDGAVVAACYFKPLAGDVATLGRIRAAEGWEEAAVELLVRQALELRQYGVPQIQAVVAESDDTTPLLLRRGGWTFLTHVQHQWLDRTQFDSDPAGYDSPSTPSSLWWRPADTFARSRLARSIEATFQQTLDCPALNGLRDNSQVLKGFLDGRSLHSAETLWEVLEYRGELAGCLLMQAHGRELLELVYLGLLPEARGQRLGQQLVRRAMLHCQQRDAQALVAAVDEQNWPALELYRQLGFQPQQRFEVWLQV